ncbi:interleukin-18 isoform X2 [Rhinoderma darwinii]|uniref:interleukin-18 isoform X2 n=1 Tax=Rhinoderma darwinii TaxID=43563 RepID=UPI003F66E03A
MEMIVEDAGRDSGVCTSETIKNCHGKFLDAKPAGSDVLLVHPITDAYKNSGVCVSGTIENCHGKFLEAEPAGSNVIFVNPCSDNQIFDLYIYNSSEQSEGPPVAFSLKYKNEKYYMSCKKDLNFYFTKGDCPKAIKGNRSEIIFFQKEFSQGDHSVKFQSSLQTDYYLSVSGECDSQKLILKKPCEEVDETLKFYVC